MKIYQNLHKIYHNLLKKQSVEYCTLYPNIPKYTKVSLAVQQYTTINYRVPKDTKIYKKIFKNIQKQK